MEKAGLRFEVRTKDLTTPVYVDKQMWEKIVFNLLSNAFKFTFEGKITLELFSENENAILKVSDTGVGIPDVELPYMFDRFHRVENAAGRTFEGSGIGLSLVKELVGLHNGTISVESQLAKGSTFTVTIPLGKEHLPAEQVREVESQVESVVSDVYVREATSLLNPDPSASIHGAIAAGSNGEEKAGTILVVDDNADMRQHIRYILEKKYHVITASNGKEALEILEKETPSLVLSDIMMPVMDGIQLLKEIKRNRKTMLLPVILLTARAGEESKIEGLETGADDYLVKPFAANELSARIHSHISLAQKRNEIQTNLREFLMQAPAAIAVLEGPEHVYTMANPLYQKLHGKTEEELVGKSVKEVYPDDEAEETFLLLDKITETGEAFSISEHEALIMENGKEKKGYYNSIIQPVKDARGKVSQLIGFGIEITEQVLSRQKIEESENLFRAVLERSPDLITIFTGEDMILKIANSAANHIWNIDADAIGKPLREVKPELIHQGFEEMLKEAYHNEKTITLTEIPLALMQGDAKQTYYFNATVQPFLFGDKTKGLLMTATNITSMVEARRTVEASESELRIILETSPNVICLFKGENMVLKLANEKMYEVVRINPKFIGSPLLEFFPELKEQGFWDLLQDVYHNGKTIEGKETPVYFNREDEVQETHYYNFSYVPFREKNIITGVFVTANDVTEQVAIRRKIADNEKELQQLVLQAPVAIVLVEGENMVAKVANATSLQIMGKTEQEVLGKPMHEFMPEAGERQNVYKEVFHTGIPYEGKEVKVSFKRNGKPYTGFFDLNYTPWYSSEGKIKGVMSVGVEVTEKFLSRQRIEESEARVRTIFEQAPVGIAIYRGKDFVVEFANDYMLAFYGKKREDIINKKIFEVFPEVESHGVKEMHDNVFRSGKSFKAYAQKHEYYKNGELYIGYFDIGFEPMREPDGTVTGLIITGHEVTEQVLVKQEMEKLSAELEKKVKKRTRELKQQNELLQKQNELVRKVFDSTFDLIAVYDRDMRIMSINKPALKMWQGEEDEVIGKKLLDVFPFFSGTRGEGDLVAAINGKTIHNEVYVSEVTGNYYENFLIPLRAQDNEVYAVLAVAHDNTKLIKSSENLKEKNVQLESAQSFLQQLIDSSIEMISVLDKNLNYITVNKKFEEDAHVKRDKVYGKHLFDILPDARDSEKYKVILRALEGETVHLDKRPSITRPDIIVDSYFIPLVILGGIEGVIIMSRNVTNIVHSEALLAERNQDLERSNKELESFNYIASHDMQEPLRKIQMFIQLIEKNKSDAGVAKKYFDKITSSAQRMSELIQSVLTYSRLSKSGEGFTQTDLNAVLEGVKSDFELLMKEKKVTIKSSKLPLLTANPLQMNQLFSNLIGNSIKFAKEKPVIKITAEVVKGKDLPHSDAINPNHPYVHLRFADNGIGFEQEYSEKIFSLFQRLHGKDEYSGTGIGLSIVKKIVDQHKGYLSAESTPGEGAVFNIWLPA